jgi:hypothetical protein
MRIRALGVGDGAAVAAAGHLFDGPPDTAATARFLAEPGHHLLIAYDSDERPVGFVSGVETTHPDKGTEMFLTSSPSTSPPVAGASAARSSRRWRRWPGSAAATACGCSPTTTTSRRWPPIAPQGAAKPLGT